MRVRRRGRPIADELLCTPTELRQSTWPQKGLLQPAISVVDLFSGCGGLSLGAAQAAAFLGRAFRIDLAIDFNVKALEVYRLNFEREAVQIQCGDISRLVDLTSKKLAATAKESRALPELESPSVLLAGPPCQGHSDLNNSSRRLDPRNLLYLAPARFAASIRPEVLLVENVPSVTRASEGVVELSRQLLESLGYFVEEAVVNLTQFGVPQSRNRHIQIASKKPLDGFFTRLSLLTRRSAYCNDYIKDISDRAAADSSTPFDQTTRLTARNRERIDYLFDNELFDLPNSLRPPCHQHGAHSYTSMYGRMYPDRPAQTITSGFGSMGQGRFVHPTQRRMITAHEAARLQGFPDYFQFDVDGVTALREMIGNAVPPSLSKVILTMLANEGHV